MKLKINLINFRKLLYFLISGIALWLLLIVLAPIFKSTEMYILKSTSDYVYFFFEPVCHQMPGRSILINNEPLAVCTRCFAIYLGGFFFLLFLIFQKNIYNINPSWMILVSLPTAVDLIMEKFGFYMDIPVVRFITGFIFGIAIMYLILYSIMDVKNENLTNRKIYYGKSEIN